MIHARLGRKHSLETKTKMSLGLIGQNKTVKLVEVMDLENNQKTNYISTRQASKALNNGLFSFRGH